MSVWVSPERVAEYRKALAEADARTRARPKDPRDSTFAALQRKSKKSLTSADKAKLVRYCDAMLAYLKATDKEVSAASWISYRRELLRSG